MCGLSTVVTPAGASLTMYREIRSYANSIWDDNNNNNNIGEVEQHLFSAALLVPSFNMCLINSYSICHSHHLPSQEGINTTLRRYENLSSEEAAKVTRTTCCMLCVCVVCVLLIIIRPIGSQLTRKKRGNGTKKKALTVVDGSSVEPAKRHSWPS